MRSVRELLDGISAAELSELIAFSRLEPIGEMRADARSGMIAATIANVNRGEGQGVFVPLDFMPFIERPPARELTADEVEAELNRRFGK